MENAAAVVDVRSIVAMLNAKLIKILYATTLCSRFLAPCRNFFTNNQPFSKILMEVRACKPWRQEREAVRRTYYLTQPYHHRLLPNDVRI